MKKAIIEAMFPELKGANIYKTGRGTASSPKAAIARAVSDLFKQVKGRRISIIRSTITIINVQPEEEPERKA